MIIRPFNAAYLLLLAFAAGAVVLLWALLRGRSERCRAAVLIALCAVNIIGFFVYKGFLSRDVQFLQASGLDRFNWFNELPLQLCNINMFLIPIGILTHRRSLLGFAFFVAPLGALMALVFPEAPFVGYSLWLPRMLGYYITHMLILICGFSLTTLGFYRPRLKDLPGVTGALLTTAFAAFLVDLLLRLIRQLLLPLVYLYIGLLTAAACLPENRLGAIAEALKKLVTWILTTALLVFTIYLSIVRIISGSADSATVKVAKAAISGVVPVVGGIIADASETVLAGAGMLKNTIGVFGMLAILAACAYPFLQLGVQYLLYKLTAYLASVVGAPGLCKLIDGLGGAFGLILGMTGGCALLLLISVLASVGAVMP